MKLRRHASTQEVYGLDQGELKALSTYNEERNRGLVHTAAWREKMAALQRRYDQARRASGDITILRGGVIDHGRPGHK